MPTSGRAPFATLVGDKRFVAYPDGGHADLMQHGAVADTVAFVDSP